MRRWRRPSRPFAASTADAPQIDVLTPISNTSPRRTPSARLMRMVKASVESSTAAIPARPVDVRLSNVAPQ